MGEHARGRRATGGMPGFRGVPVRRAGKHAIQDFLDHDMTTYAAALTYHVFLALFPFILVLLAALSFLRMPELFEWLIAQAEALLASDAVAQVEQIVGEVQEQQHGGLLSLGILGALWAASAGMRSTMNALNQAYEVPDARPMWKRYGVSILYTLLLALLVILATAAMVLGPELVASVAATFGMDQVVVGVWRWIRFPVGVVLAMLAISLLYYAAPNVRQPFRFVTPGSVLAVVLWILAVVGFTTYVKNFGQFSVAYGSIGAVIVLLLYLFISAMALLLGGELNAAIAQENDEVEIHERPDE
jgi:membrane protein